MFKGLFHRRKQMHLCIYMVILFIVYQTFFEWNKNTVKHESLVNQETQTQPKEILPTVPSPEYSNVDCPNIRICRLSNVFVIDDALHVYLTQDVPFFFSDLFDDLEQHPLDITIHETSIPEEYLSLPGISHSVYFPIWTLNVFEVVSQVIRLGKEMKTLTLESIDVFEFFSCPKQIKEAILLGSKLIRKEVVRNKQGRVLRFMDGIILIPSTSLLSKKVINDFKNELLALESVQHSIPSHSICIYNENEDRFFPKESLQRTHTFDIIKKQISMRPKAQKLAYCDVLILSEELNPALFLFTKKDLSIVGHTSWIQLWDEYMDIHLYEMNLDVSKSYLPLLLDTLLGQENRYLNYMPWEQLNNQIIGFKSACAVASLTKRVLVLPCMGYRKDVDDWNFSFDVKNFEWAPIEKYYTLTDDLPCLIMKMNHYQKIIKKSGSSIGPVYFNPVAKVKNEFEIKIQILGNIS